MSVKEAKSILKENGLEIELNVNEENEMDEEQTIVVEQTPKPGIMVQSGSNVFCDV